MTPGTGLYVSLDQQRPEDMFRIFDSSLGSKPSLGKGGEHGDGHYKCVSIIQFLERDDPFLQCPNLERLDHCKQQKPW